MCFHHMPYQVCCLEVNLLEKDVGLDEQPPSIHMEYQTLIWQFVHYPNTSCYNALEPVVNPYQDPIRSESIIILLTMLKCLVKGQSQVFPPPTISCVLPRSWGKQVTQSTKGEVDDVKQHAKPNEPLNESIEQGLSKSQAIKCSKCPLQVLLPKGMWVLLNSFCKLSHFYPLDFHNNFFVALANL